MKNHHPFEKGKNLKTLANEIGQIVRQMNCRRQFRKFATKVKNRISGLVCHVDDNDMEAKGACVASKDEVLFISG